MIKTRLIITFVALLLSAAICNGMEDLLKFEATKCCSQSCTNDEAKEVSKLLATYMASGERNEDTVSFVMKALAGHRCPGAVAQKRSVPNKNQAVVVKRSTLPFCTQEGYNTTAGNFRLAGLDGVYERRGNLNVTLNICNTVVTLCSTIGYFTNAICAVNLTNWDTNTWADSTYLDYTVINNTLKLSYKPTGFCPISGGYSSFSGDVIIKCMPGYSAPQLQTSLNGCNYSITVLAPMSYCRIPAPTPGPTPSPNNTISIITVQCPSSVPKGSNLGCTVSGFAALASSSNPVNITAQVYPYLEPLSSTKFTTYNQYFAYSVYYYVPPSFTGSKGIFYASLDNTTVSANTSFSVTASNASNATTVTASCPVKSIVGQPIYCTVAIYNIATPIIGGYLVSYNNLVCEGCNAVSNGPVYTYYPTLFSINSNSTNEVYRFAVYDQNGTVYYSNFVYTTFYENNIKVTYYNAPARLYGTDPFNVSLSLSSSNFLNYVYIVYQQEGNNTNQQLTSSTYFSPPVNSTFSVAFNYFLTSSPGRYCPVVVVSDYAQAVTIKDLPCLDFYNSQCMPGEYVKNISGTTTCEPCPRGFYSPRNSLTCYACPPGYTSSCYSGSSTCIACPAGTSSKNGVCVACPAGTYTSYDGESSCKPCPGGFYNPNNSSNTCYACTYGTYSNVGAKNCSVCPAGSIAVYAATYCVECNSGYYAPAGSSNCDSCPANYYSQSGAAECIQCPAGQTSPSGSYTCF